MLAPVALVATAACVDLEVTNPNNPDIARALASPADVARIAQSSVQSWYLAATHYEPAMMLQVTADAATANFGNFGMRFNNEEPRIPYNNQSASGDELAARRPWVLHYSAIGAANDAMKALANGVTLGTTAKDEVVKSQALWTQAATLSEIALLFDKGFVVDENLEGLPELKSYADMKTAALAKWDALIALTAGKTWQWDAAAFPMFDVPQVTAAVLNRMAKTMAARLLVLSARTPSENTATSWSSVLSYANAGITGTGLIDMDISVTGDGGVNWYDYIKLYGNLDNWTRVDQRLINRMDADIPSRFNGVTNQLVSTPNDNRLGVRVGTCGSNPTTCLTGVTNDYVDLRTVIGDPGRGITKQSTFYHQRYRAVSFGTPLATHVGKEMIYVLAAENDLMIAEALVRTGGDKARAATLINKTRVTRGGLTALTGAESNTALLDAIDYERDVELLNTNGIVTFADRRRGSTTMFNPGTFRHLPLPAKELEVLNLPIYTFGGVGSPDM
jgi:hypothetical protein